MYFKSLAAVAAAAFLIGTAAAQTPASPAPAPARPAPTVVSVVPPALTPDTTWHLDLSTGGRVTIQLRPDAAPGHVDRIRTLTRQGFYDGIVFHRVIQGFMAQAGDPRGTGAGGSTLPDLAAEFNTLPHVRGTVGMARTENPNSANSQFYIMFSPGFALDNDYTVVGRVVGGMNFVDAITRGDPPANPTRILRASIDADNVAPPAAAELAVSPPPPASPQ
jgi:cyclophilin family peptidyl-prolyl cis-trans isomerase